ncbi:MAG: hypothetical protein AB1696_10735 [Planctomycetota bacterium]
MRRTSASLLTLLVIHAICLADIYKFDMGPKDSPVWPGFTRVGADTVYSKETGFGLRSATGVMEVVRKDGARLRPDGLCGDMILAATEPPTPYPKSEKILKPGGEFEFCLDLPNGTYGVYCILGDDGSQYDTGLPFADFYIKAEGEQKLFVEVGEKAPVGYHSIGKKFYYQRLNDVFSPQDDLWEKYVNRGFAPQRFNVQVNDGQLNLVVGNRPLNVLIVYPESERQQAEQFIANLTEARRKAWAYREFKVEYNREPPKPTAEHQARGYMIFTPSYLESVPYYYPPKASEVKTWVSCFAAKSEFEPVTFAVLPLESLGKCSVRVSDLVGETGGQIAKENIDVRVVKHLERAFTQDISRVEMGYYVDPLLLMKWPDVRIEKGVVRQFWLTIHVPEDAKSGRYKGRITFSPQGGHPVVIDLKLIVLPFALGELTDKFHAVYWYSTGLTLFKEQTIADLRDHGMNVIHTPPAAKVALKDNELTFDLSETEKVLEQYRKCGYPMRMVISQSESNQVENLTGERSRIPGAHRFRPKYSERHKDLTRQVVRRVAEEYKKRGWPELIFYCDGEVEPEGVENTIQQIDLVEEGGGQASVNFLCWDGFVKAASHMSVVQFSPSAGYLMADMMEVARKAGKKRIFHYYLGFERLERGFYFWKTGAEGTAIEGYINVYGDPYNEFDGGMYTWGSVWPSPNGPVPSPEWEWQREGIDDCKYLSLLTRLIGEAKASNRPEVAQAAAEAEAEIEVILSNIHPEITHYRQSMRPKRLYNWDVRMYDVYRWRVIVQILKLRRALGVEDDPVLASDLMRVKLPDVQPALPKIVEGEQPLPEMQDPKGWETAQLAVSSDGGVVKEGKTSLALKVGVNYADGKGWPRMGKALPVGADLKGYANIEFWALARTRKKPLAIPWSLGLSDSENKVHRYQKLHGLKDGEWVKIVAPIEPLLTDCKGYSMQKPSHLRFVMYDGEYEDGDEVELYIDGIRLTGRKLPAVDDGIRPLDGLFADW